jgi:hypothetical protein
MRCPLENFRIVVTKWIGEKGFRIFKWLHLSVALYSNPWRARWFQICFKSKEGHGSDPMCPSVNLQLKKRAKGPKILDLNE